jgi:hypothetical protein
VRSTTLDLVGRRSAGSTRRIPPGGGPPDLAGEEVRLLPFGAGRRREGKVASPGGAARRGRGRGRRGATGWSRDGGDRVSWDGESPRYPQGCSTATPLLQIAAPAAAHAGAATVCLRSAVCRCRCLYNICWRQSKYHNFEECHYYSTNGGSATTISYLFEGCHYVRKTPYRAHLQVY